jgi:hypothetical protein
MITRVVETLRSGPREFPVIAAALGSREAADCAIRGAIEKKLIIQDGRKYRLPIPPPEDHPLPRREITVRGFCYCGNPVYRRGARFCSHACHCATMVKVRPGCAACGRPILRGQNKFCSSSCRRRLERGVVTIRGAR